MPGPRPIYRRLMLLLLGWVAPGALGAQGMSSPTLDTKVRVRWDDGERQHAVVGRWIVAGSDSLWIRHGGLVRSFPVDQVVRLERAAGKRTALWAGAGALSGGLVLGFVAAAAYRECVRSPDDWLGLDCMFEFPSASAQGVMGGIVGAVAGGVLGMVMATIVGPTRWAPATLGGAGSPRTMLPVVSVGSRSVGVGLRLPL
jgi:hypothetical protein